MTFLLLFNRSKDYRITLLSTQRTRRFSPLSRCFWFVRLPLCLLSELDSSLCGILLLLKPSGRLLVLSSLVRQQPSISKSCYSCPASRIGKQTSDPPSFCNVFLPQARRHSTGGTGWSSRYPCCFPPGSICLHVRSRSLRSLPSSALLLLFVSPRRLAHPTLSCSTFRYNYSPLPRFISSTALSAIALSFVS